MSVAAPSQSEQKTISGAPRHKRHNEDEGGSASNKRSRINPEEQVRVMWASSLATFVEKAGKRMIQLSANIEFPSMVGRDGRDLPDEVEKVIQYLEAVANFLESSKENLAHEA